jgi:ABC-2 type transport system permease protein
MSAVRFSPARFTAILVKEFVQMRRDRLTFGMMIGIPIMQLLLFGFAINADPRALPTAVMSADRSQFERSFVRAMENTTYFRVVRHVATEAEAQRLIETGQVQFVVAFPEHFARDLQRGTRPAVLIEADATDPAATGRPCWSRPTPPTPQPPATPSPRSSASTTRRSTTI